MTTIVAFSHLRWDFVYQRPQHLLSRLALRSPVIFIEEPVRDTAPPWLERIDAAPGVTVLRVHAKVDAPGFHDAHLAVMRSLLGPALAELEGAIAWLYTPMALPLLADLDASAIVYDCMDELTGFRNAPRQLAQRERALLQRADLVFTGGPSLFQAKRHLHESVHCFPSSVDATHFGRAMAARSGVHRLHADIPSPRLGFFGVIDERFDPALVEALAIAEPTWQIVLVGPVLKIDARSLPRRANIHYLGMQPYAELPELIADWDLGLVPFAHNESTRFVSPTKILEYMAAGKPIVSTAIRDVVDPYAGVVAIADHPADFVEACQAALAESPGRREQRMAAMRAIVDTTSWDRTVDAMSGLIDEVVAARAESPARAAAVGDAVRDGLSDPDLSSDTDASNEPEIGDLSDGRVFDASLRTVAQPIPVGCAVIGAGPTGLSAGYHLQSDVIVFEREAQVGGWCRSIDDHGFTFDIAGHIMFSNNPIVHEMYRVLLGDNVHWQNREAWVYSHGVHTRYPFQGALYGLPPDVLKECLVGAIESRFGPIDGSERSPEPPRPQVRVTEADDAAKMCLTEVDDCCGDGEHVRPAGAAVLPTTTLPAGVVPLPSAPRNFEEFIYRTWGAGVAKHFAVPYNKKLWTVPLSDIETSWLGGRVPLPDLAEMIEGAVQPAKKPVGPNARFGYPLRGGFQALMDGFLPHLTGGRLELNADVVAIDLKRHRFALADGRRYAYDKLISTMPLPRLVALIGDAAPQSVRTAAAGLRHVSVRCVNLGVAREDITEKHWIYYPGDTVFHRIFVQGNASPNCNPPGGFGLTCEISHAPNKPLPCDGEALIQRCFDDCVKVGLLRPDDRLITSNQVDMGYAYVIYDHARAANVGVIRDWLAHYDVILAGRYSEWEYYNSDHAFLAGHKAASQVRGEVAGAASGAA